MLGNIVGKGFDDIFGQGFDQGLGGRGKTMNTVYSTTRPKEKAIRNLKQKFKHMFKPYKTTLSP